jgi:hypothetical protein
MKDDRERLIHQPDAPGWRSKPRPPLPREDEQPPANPIFDRAPDPRGKLDAAEIAQLKKTLPELVKKLKGGRRSRFYPYLFVRSFAGDKGARPIPAGQTQSCDIWVARGDPSAAPAIPPKMMDFDQGSPPIPHTMYAHVWNIGHAPVVGAIVEFHVENKTEGQPRHRIGAVRVDLASRLAPHACHKLVKCPTPLVVTMNWQALYVRVSCIGDNLNDPNSFDPSTDRHVARFDIQPF